MPAHERQEPPVFSARWIELLPDLEEVVVDEPDDVEAVGNDSGVWKETSGDPAVGF